MTRIKEKYLNEEPHNTIHFVNTSHHNTLLDGLNTLRQQGKLFDINLVVEGQLFRAHKVVLSACSDYFRAMFTDNMLESRQDEICLNGVTSNGFQQLLEYAYTSKLSLNLSNVQDVLDTASHIQFVDVINMCSNYLQPVIDFDNCVDIVTIAETYSLKRLTLTAYKFISGHLQEFSRRQDFYRLSPQQLQNLLAYDFPVDCSEAEVLRIAWSWFFHFDNSETDRIAFATDLVKSIRFTEINELESVMDKMPVYTPQERKLFKIIKNEALRQISSSKGKVAKYLLNSRGMELALLNVGGFGINGITNEITYRFSNKKTWHHLTSIPHVEQCNFGTAVLNNELFVIGGCFNQSLEEYIHPFGFKYSARSNKWSTIAPMNIERCRFTLNAIGNVLYAIGGDTERSDIDSGACECYNTTTDTWSLIASLPLGLIQHAGASYGDNDSNYRLYISGGVDRGFLQSHMYCYEVANDKWRLCAFLMRPRADHVMLPIGKFIYACGGWTEDRDTRLRSLIDTIDVYDVERDTWSVLTSIPTPRYHAGINNVGNKIYFIGGYQSDSMFDKVTAAIECYDIEQNSWTTEDKYPKHIWEHTCATLYIPKYRDDMEIMPLDLSTN